MSDYGPSLNACRLFRKTSSKGTTYFVGRWGMLKVAMLKSKDTADDGSEIWNLVVSQAPAPNQQRQNQPQQRDDAPQSNQVLRSEPNLDLSLNDEIPF